MQRIKLLIIIFFLGITSLLKAQFPVVLEAEKAKLFGSLEILNHSGFSNEKYVANFIINSDSYLLFDNVNVSQAGTYELKAFTTGSKRPFTVKVNSYERSLHWTTDSPDWNAPPAAVTSALVYLDAGVNVIRIGAEIEHGPNIDKFEIHKTSASIEKPQKVNMAFSYDFTDEATITAEHANGTLAFLTDNDESTYYEVSGVNSTTITVDCKESKVITSMLLSAGRGVDVSGWKVEYSTNGSTWQQLTPASSQTVGMGDMTLFAYDITSLNAKNFAARYFRLTAKGSNKIRIAEWQLFGIPLASPLQPLPADITAGGNIQTQASASPQGHSGQTYTNLFDRKISTKYSADGTRMYVQYVLDQAYKLSSYTITSANDAPEKDPKLWSFSGYNPEEGWIELDEQLNFQFPGRLATMKFDINSEKEFTAFILEVSGVKAGSAVQLGNLQVFGTPTGNPAKEPALPSDPSADPKERAAELVRLMTKSEKLLYVGGMDWMYTKDIPRLNIPRTKMSDGPQGLGTWGASTAYPVAILLAASWNEDLAYDYGEALAADCRARGVNILLGPGVNIHRAPMCGRNFEYMGEDPYLTSRTAVGYIKGLQENGVMAVIKHFTANFQEYDRNYVSSDIDERTLNEIYFPAFKAAIKEANVGSVMSSYNLLNGVWTTHDPWLLRSVLREQWDFEGILMSDWGSTHACLPAANGGLDLEMPTGERMTPDSLRYYLNKGELQMSTIDEKVQHTLQTLIRFGFFDKEQEDTSIPKDNPESVQTALKVAREGMVLLKNEGNLLPLKADKIKKVAVVGKNAKRYLTGGGSGRVEPIHYVSFYEGIAAVGAQKGIEVKFIDTNDHLDDVVFTGENSQTSGFSGQYFNNVNLQGTATGTRIDRKIDFDFQNGTGVEGIGTANYSVRWTGELRPQATGEYTFTLGGDDGFRLYIDNSLVIDDWNPGQERYKTYTKALTTGTKYQIKVEYYQASGGAVVDFYWSKAGDGDYMLAAMNEADVVIACFGHDASTEAEAGDRTFALPAAQAKFVEQVLKTTTPIVGVVTAGGNVEMQSWNSKLKGLLWAWYSGQEGGTALGEILFGDVNPSGKLPVSFEKKWSDNPTFNSYYDSDGDKHVQFSEGVFVGYRGYDKLNREVQYPFGYGLSYTTFNLSDMTIEETTQDNFIYKVSCELKNTGAAAGAQVVQLYVGKKGESKVEKPLKELKAFKKVYLEPGESKTVTLFLSKDAFSYFDIDKTAFVMEDGLYEVSLGFSSRELVLKKDLNAENPASVSSTHITDCRLIPSAVKAGESIRISSGVARRVNVYNITGTSQAYFENTGVIHTHGFSQGIYIAYMDINKEKISRKFIVK